MRLKVPSVADVITQSRDGSEVVTSLDESHELNAIIFANVAMSNAKIVCLFIYVGLYFTVHIYHINLQKYVQNLIYKCFQPFLCSI